MTIGCVICWGDNSQARRRARPPSLKSADLVYDNVRSRAQGDRGGEDRSIIPSARVLFLVRRGHV
jgi:hypothetical protein